MKRWILLALVVPSAACAGPDAGPTPASLLDAPVVEHLDAHRPALEAFSTLPTVFLFSDGTALALDGRLDESRLIEPDGHDRPVGRTGTGPGEFREVSTVFGWAGDTAAVYDRKAGRLMLVTREGVTDQVVPLPSEAVFWGAQRAGDANRNVYFAHREARGMEHPSDVPVTRWNASSGVVDTVALVLAPGVVTATHEPTPGTRVELVVPQPFDPRDLWAVLPSGDLVILRCCDSLRLDRVMNGEPNTGPAYSPPPGAPITDVDREPYEGMEYLGHEWVWPERRPPIGDEGLIIGTDASLWARLEMELDDDTRYAEFSADGRIVRTHRLHGRRYVVAVDDSRILAVERDDSDLYRLEVYSR